MVWDDVQLRSVLESTPDLIAVVEPDGTIRALAGAVEPMLGPGWTARVGTNLRDLAPPEDASGIAAFVADVAKEPGAARRAEWRIRHEDGSIRHVEALASNRMAQDGLNGLVVTARDVEQRKALEAQLHHQAFHDPLTHLPNRAMFYDRVELALARQVGGDRLIALLFCDLDDFRGLNEELGHAVGDAVLEEAARRLRGCLRAADTAARLGGDEFGILLEGVSGPNEPVQIAQRILAAFAEPFYLRTGPVRVRCSLGVAVSAPSQRGSDEILRQADLAMYAAKRNGKERWELYGEEMDDRHPGDREDENTWYARSYDQREEIAEMVERPDALTMVYQPIVDLRTGKVAGYEALSRFAHPSKRPPNAWFAQAHRCGLGFRLEAIALAKALESTDRPEGTFLSVNISPSALTSPDLHAALPERLHGLVLEITETEHVPDAAPLRAAVARLRSRGAKLAVDDAGAGYSGLTSVMRLAPDIIKLDRALVDGVNGDRARAALIESFVRYAREIHATVCAEGIETLVDLECLADLDVTYGQGYALARPGPPWVGVTESAAETCLSSRSAILQKASQYDTDNQRAHDRRLEWLTVALSEANSYVDLARALAPIAEDLHADEIVLSEVSEDGTMVRTIGAYGPMRDVQESFGIDEYPQTALVLRTQEAVQVLVTDPEADPEEVRLMRELGVQSMLMLPVLCGGKAIGLFECYRTDDRPWSRFELSRARILTLQIGATLERVQRRVRSA